MLCFAQPGAGRVRDQQRRSVALGDALDARGQVHGVADHGQHHSVDAADQSDAHGAGVDPDAHAQLLRSQSPPFFVVVAQRAQHGQAGPHPVGRRLEDSEDLVAADVLHQPVATDDGQFDRAQEAHRQVARLGDVHVLEHGRVAADVADEHGHLAFDAVARADPAKVVDVEDAQDLVRDESGLGVDQGLPVLVGGLQLCFQREVPQRCGGLGAQEGQPLELIPAEGFRGVVAMG